MALSNGKTFDSNPLVFITPRSKDADGNKVEPYLEVSRVGADGKIAKTNERPTRVNGNLVKIDFKDREIKGTTSKQVVLYVSDPIAKETYHISLSYRMATRGLFNALLSLGSTDDISISYYENRGGYEAFGLTQKGDRVAWKIELADQPKSEAITDKKGNLIKNDYSDVDSFFENELKALVEKLGIAGRKTEEKPSSPQKSDAPVNASKIPTKQIESVDDPIPF
jgi:hypothetical protein